MTGGGHNREMSRFLIWVLVTRVGPACEYSPIVRLRALFSVYVVVQ